MGVLVVAAGLLLGACGSDKSKSAAPAPAASSGGGAGQTVKVSETEFKLNPANPSVGKTGKVKIQVTNDGSTTHALEVEGPNGEVKTAPIQPGKSATLNADLSKAGSYQWYCPIGNHKAMGMKGTIKVAGGGSGGTKTDDSGGKPAGGGGY
jgi:plastocyanin